MSFLRRPRTWLVGIPVLVLLVAVVGPFLYIHFLEGDPPDPFALSTSTLAGTGAPLASLDGSWMIADGSEVGYRIKEVLFGQDATAVGRTSAITGSLSVAGTTVRSASFEVDVASISSERSQRDSQFRGRIMEVSQFPTATFTLTSTIELGSVPKNRKPIHASATGDLTLHGVTKAVTFDVTAQLNGSAIELQGTITVTFTDYGIDDPSGGPATVGDTGEMEFLLILAKS